MKPTRQMKSAARLYAVQALFQMEAAGQSVDKVKAEFLADLQVIRASLEEHSGRHAGLSSLRRLQQRVRTFGFNLVTLDVRQDALLHPRQLGRAHAAAGAGHREESFHLVVAQAELQTVLESVLHTQPLGFIHPVR